MFGDDIVVHTRLLPPRLPRHWLHRSRLDQRLALAAEHRLTTVTASPGYGKSSALAAFAARGGWPCIWLTLDAGCDDPLVFLLHLIAACRRVVPHVGSRSLALLEEGGQVWRQALDALGNDLLAHLDDETILIIDDFHLVQHHAVIVGLVERLLQQLPPLLHVLIASRSRPQLGMLPTMRARGEVLEIDERDLTFTDDEIAELFAAAYDMALPSEDARLLRTKTGGWAIALQLMGQSSGLAASERESPRPTLESRNERLFAYLAHDVLAGQPQPIRAFLLRASLLSELRPDLCAAVLDAPDAAALLAELYGRGLFMTRIGADTYQFHPLFREFLQQRAREHVADWRDLHLRAAAYFRQEEADEPMLTHLAAAGEPAMVASELARLAESWIKRGRLVTLLSWLDTLSPDLLRHYPHLMRARGDALRLQARFDEAQAAYRETEVLCASRHDLFGQSEALRGQALVFLDTVQPAQADDLLRRAYKLLPADAASERLSLLHLLAENRVNTGLAGQAERLARMIARQGGDVRYLRPRILMRMGRLTDARALVEAELPRARAALARGRVAEGHREATVLLSLICLLQGDQAAALSYALQGVEDARQLGSTLLESVAHTRLGHALQLGPTPDLQAANRHYLQALALADSFGIRRRKAEAYAGLVLLHGFSGDLPAAQAAAHESLAAIEQSGDFWMSAIMWMALAAVGVASNTPDAALWIEEARRRYRRCGDTYGQALADLWSSIRLFQLGNAAEATPLAVRSVRSASTHDPASLFLGTTLLGPRDRMMLVPVLFAGRSVAETSRTAQDLMVRGFPALAGEDPVSVYHPGSTLRVALFEQLRVWRGAELVEGRAWQRKKAHQLLGLLLTKRHRWMLREQICEWLWPDEQDAESQFKVTLNALNAALEPHRPPRVAPFYIRRQGSAYRFLPPDGVWLDVEEFEQRIARAQLRLSTGADQEVRAARDDLLLAVGLYQGDYLHEYLYEEWAREERERLASRYLDAATTLAELLLARNQTLDAIRLCESIIMRDASWEHAYVLLMRAYAKQGNRRMVAATYDRCVRNMRAHLDAPPMYETTHLYETLRA